MLRAARRAAVGCISLLVGLWTTLACRDANAEPQCSNVLVSTCINSDSFWPHAGPQRFAGVGGTETLPERQVAFGVVTSYLSRPIVMQIASPGPTGSESYVIDNQVNSNFLFAYGVTSRLQLDVGMPITLVQTGAGTSALTGGRPIRDTAVRDLRYGFAYSLIPRKRTDPIKAAEEGGAGGTYSLAARMTMSAPIGDNTDFSGERTVVFSPSFAGDIRVSRLFFGLELGMRYRPVTEFAGARIGTQVTAGAGAGVDVLSKDLFSVLLEGRAAFNFAEQHDSQQSQFGILSVSNGTRIIPAEWMLGVRSAPLLAGDVSFYLGGGGPIPITDGAITIPRFRFVLGLTYAPTAKDTDGDGVPDRIDRCPTVPGVRSGENPGCPPPPPAPPPPPQAPADFTAPAAPVTPSPTPTAPSQP